MIESTGTFPPAAVPIMNHKKQNTPKLVTPATAQAKTPPIKTVALKAGFLPMKSQEIPQNKAPKMRPT